MSAETGATRAGYAGSAFALSPAVRHGITRSADPNDRAMRTAAVVAFERLMRAGRYSDAAHAALLGRRLRAASQALRRAAACGELAFAELFSREFEGIAFRDALDDPFLAVGVALSRRGHLAADARDELLATAAARSARVGCADDAEVDGYRADPDAQRFEHRAWQSLIELMALRALHDWEGLARAARTAQRFIAAAPQRRFAGIGPLRGMLCAHLELALALTGEPEFRPLAHHRRYAETLHPQDRGWALGCVALAAVSRGEVREAEALLRRSPLENVGGSDGRRCRAEQLGARGLICMEHRDARGLGAVIEEFSRCRADDAGLADLRTMLQARHVFMSGYVSRAFEVLGRVPDAGSLPWARAEAFACRLERCLSVGQHEQAQTMVEEVQRTPYAKWHVVRLAIAKRSLAQNRATGAFKIAVSVRDAVSANSRNRARALAIAAACAHQLGDPAAAQALLREMRDLCREHGLQEPYDDLLPGQAAHGKPSEPEARLRPALPTPVGGPTLTKRERVVLQHLRETASTEEIAAALQVSKNTVKTQLRSIYRKLDARSRDAALAAAFDEGLIDTPRPES